MKFLIKCKDGGPESTVTAYVLIEIKCLFSVMLLRFDDGSREAFHTHAFNALSWVLRGSLREIYRNGYLYWHHPGVTPIVTLRETYHKVASRGTSWVLTLRGPWAATWRETSPVSDLYLTHGRREVAS